MSRSLLALVALLLLQPAMALPPLHTVAEVHRLVGQLGSLRLLEPEAAGCVPESF